MATVMSKKKHFYLYGIYNTKTKKLIKIFKNHDSAKWHKEHFPETKIVYFTAELIVD